MHHPRRPRTLSSPQITSKGCSRGFILCVLFRALDFVRQQQMKGRAVQFPCSDDVINRWLSVLSNRHFFVEIFSPDYIRIACLRAFIAALYWLITTTISNILTTLIAMKAAQEDCSICEQAYQDGLGGTLYDEADTSTYWTQPQQFCTWWKNNVERKNKFLLLQRDAAYCYNDQKQIARYC